MATIEWHEAEHEHEHQNERREIERKRLIEEIKTSNFQYLDARDVNYYAEELGITPNEVRDLNKQAQGLSNYDYLNTFDGDDLDSIFDYF